MGRLTTKREDLIVDVERTARARPPSAKPADQKAAVGKGKAVCAECEEENTSSSRRISVRWLNGGGRKKEKGKFPGSVAAMPEQPLRRQ